MRRNLVLLVFAALLLPCLIRATDKEGMRINDLFRVRRAGSPAISPDGNWIVYTISAPHLKRNKTFTHLYRVSFTGNDTLQLTRGEKSEWNPQWDPDGEVIAFSSNRSGKTELWGMNPFYGEPYQLTDVATGVRQWRWSHDGSMIAFTSRDSLTEKEERERKAGKDAKVVDEDFRMAHLYVIHVNTKKVQRLTRGEFTVSNPEWSTDDQFVYFEKRPTPKADDRWKSDIMRVSSDSGAVRAVVATKGTDTHPLASPDSQFLALSHKPGPGNRIGNVRLAVVPASGGELNIISEDFDGSIYATRWSPYSRFIYFSAIRGVSSNLFKIDVKTGEVTNISENENILSNFSFSDDCKRVAFTMQKPDMPSEIYNTEMDVFAPRHLTFSNKWLDFRKLGQTEVLKWKSHDGMDIEGLLVKPLHYQKDEPVPTIVRVHGGPSGVYTRSFMASWANYPHILAAQGYATFMPNFRGSFGYGEEFLRADIRDWGIGDYQDIMSGVDSLIAWKISDPEKLGIAGWSYGGYMTFWTVTQTNRFEVASAGAGLTNIFSMYSENDIPSVLDAYFGAEPWEDPEEYQRASPISDVKNVETPLLILQGEADVRVPKYQSMEFYTALNQMGKKTKMVIFPRQGHGIGELRLQKQKVEEELGWLNRYIKQIPPKPEEDLITTTDMLNLPSIGSPQISPDGETVLFTISERSGDDSSRVSHIYKIDLKGIDKEPIRKPLQLTRSEKGEKQPRWSPKGDRFAYLSSGENEKSQIFVMNPFYGEAEMVSEAKTGVDNFRWSPDGKSIAFTKVDTLTEKERKRREAGHDAKVWEQTEQKRHLWTLDVKSGETTRLTQGDFNVLEFAWSPNGEEIAFTRASFRVAEEMSKSRLQVIDIQTKEIKDIFHDEIGFHHIRWSPDGNRLAVLNSRGKEIGDIIRQSNIFVVNRDGSGKKNITEKQVWDVSDFEWLPDGNRMILIGQYGVSSHFYTLSLLDNQINQLSTGNYERSRFTMSDKGSRICFLRSDANHLSEILWSPVQSYQENRLFSMNEELSRFKLAETETIEWPSTDEMEIEGLLVKPPNFEESLRYPTVVIPHGGPVGHYSLRFNKLAQLFAANGYVVLLPNVRGSNAYGRDFLRANIGDLGGGDFQDMMNGIDYLIEKGISDKERLGIWGWSYGGYMSAWAITQTDRFKAAVVGAGVTNWFSVYGQDDIQYDVEEYFLGTPYVSTKLVEERSPMFQVTNVETPTLILHGEEDFRDPLPQAKNFYLALKKQNVPVELVIYPREGHGIREYRHRRDMLKRSIHWMNKYMAPKLYVSANSKP